MMLVSSLEASRPMASSINQTSRPKLIAIDGCDEGANEEVGPGDFGDARRRVARDVRQFAADAFQAGVRKALANALGQQVQRGDDLVGIERAELRGGGLDDMSRIRWRRGGSPYSRSGGTTVDFCLPRFLSDTVALHGYAMTGRNFLEALGA